MTRQRTAARETSKVSSSCTSYTIKLGHGIPSTLGRCLNRRCLLMRVMYFSFTWALTWCTGHR